MTKKRPNFPELDDTAKLTCRPLEDAALSMPTRSDLALDIFGGGIAFRHAEPVEPGKLIALELEVPGLAVSVIALGRCVWCEPHDGPPADRPHDVGAKLHWIGWGSPTIQNDIAGLIRGALDSGGSLRLARVERDG